MEKRKRAVSTTTQFHDDEAKIEKENGINKVYNNKDDHYFDSCSFHPIGTLVDRQGQEILTDRYIIRGRYNDFVKEFDHNPTDREINNALVFRFGLNSGFLM